MQRITDETVLLFQSSLKQETKLLKRWFDERYFCNDTVACGFEFEYWLTDHQGQLANHNLEFLSQYQNPAVVPEVGRSSLEINTQAFTLTGAALSRLQENLSSTWEHCRQAAKALDLNVFTMGMPPYIEKTHIENNMTQLPRFIYINENMAFLRQHRPYHIYIEGDDSLSISNSSLGINGFTSSFQIHMQIPLHDAKRYYNAAQIAAAPLLAIAGNSPYFCGKSLWSETRIPSFEQVMRIQASFCNDAIDYCTFGKNYIQHSLMELFEENYNDFPPLIPLHCNNEIEAMQHIQLQNSAIYRWNRPVIDFNSDGRPHLRIEFRALPAGPSVIDMVANAAFFYGLNESLATQEIPPENCLSFTAAKQNFYQAAQKGLNSKLHWFKQQRINAVDLVQQLLPVARKGLTALAIDSNDIDFYLGVIQDRIKHCTNGSHWAKQYMQHHPNDFTALTSTIIEQQERGDPIHCWPTH